VGKDVAACDRFVPHLRFRWSTIDRAIAMTQLSGLKVLYHSSPFETWGHLQLKPDAFPNGWDGFRACVVKARKAASASDSTPSPTSSPPTDPLVTPNPDPRLARIGASELTADIDCGAKRNFCRRPYVLSEENRDEYRNGRRGTGQVRRGLRRSAVAAAPL